jgi:hypothetical protein
MRTDLFACPLFVLSVLLLLVNDWLLKPAFHNSLTGKLSDFAGLSALMVFACALAPRHRWHLAALISASFLYWKSPHSQGMLDLVNRLSPVSIGRTVDYTDLMALPVLWLVAAIALRMRALSSRVWLQQAFAVVSLFAFTATSISYIHGEREVAELRREVPRQELQELIDRIAARHGLHCSVCDPLVEGRLYGLPGWREFSFLARLEPASHQLLYEIASRASVKSELKRKEVDALRSEFVAELQAWYPGLTLAKAPAPRPQSISVLVKHTTPGKHNHPDNLRDFELARQLIAQSLVGYGMKQRARSEITEHYDFGRLVGRGERELTAYVWLGDRLVGVRITRSDDRVREMHERMTRELRERLTHAFAAKRVDFGD